MKDKVSVIVPVYNVETYLPKCIESILNQTHKNLELILVDDGSPDKCPEICDEYAKKDKRVKVIHKKNAGVSAARNDGIDFATGDFVAFVDSDDWIEPEMYEKLLQKQQEDDYDVVFCGYNMVIDGVVYNVIEKSKGEFCKTKDLVYLLRCPNYKILNNNQYVSFGNIQCYNVRFLYRKEKIESIRFSQNLCFMEDVRIMLEIFLNKDLSVGYIDDCLYNYLVRKSSLSNGKISNLIEKGKLYIESVTELLSNTNYSNLISAEKFYIYYMCATNKIRYSTDDDLKIIKKWNIHKNYKEYKILCNGFKSKFKAFLIHYHLGFVFKLATKLKSLGHKEKK